MNIILPEKVLSPGPIPNAGERPPATKPEPANSNVSTYVSLAQDPPGQRQLEAWLLSGDLEAFYELAIVYEENKHLDRLDCVLIFHELLDLGLVEEGSDLYGKITDLVSRHRDFHPSNPPSQFNRGVYSVYDDVPRFSEGFREIIERHVPVSQLLEQLGDANEAVANRAFRFLILIAPAIFDDLVILTNDDNEQRQDYVTRLLGKTSEREAIKLIQLLDSSDITDRQRKNILRGLKTWIYQYRSPSPKRAVVESVTPRLRQLSHSSDSETAELAMQILQVSHESLMNALVSQEWEALVPVSFYLDHLSNPNESVRKLAAEMIAHYLRLTFSHIRDFPTEILRLLNEGSEKQKAGIAFALGVFAQGSFVREGTKVAKENKGPYWLSNLDNLLVVVIIEVIPSLIRLQDSTNEAVSQQAKDTLAIFARIHFPEKDIINGIQNSENAKVRAFFATVLGNNISQFIQEIKEATHYSTGVNDERLKIGQIPKYRVFISDLMSDPDPEVRAAAQTSFDQVQKAMKEIGQ